MDLCYQWLKKMPDGSHEQIAVSRMTVTWVAILGTRHCRGAAFP